MLGNINAVANLAVKDLAVARRFYEDTLGLTPADTDCEDMIAYRSGNSRINVYCSSFAGTNQATAVTWAVGGDIEGLVAALRPRACASSTTTCRTQRLRATSMSWTR